MAAAWSRAGAALGTCTCFAMQEARELPKVGKDEDPLACFLTMLYEGESHLYCIYSEKEVISTSSGVHFRAAVQYDLGEKTSDLCSLFQVKESKSIDTMVSLVTDRVPGARKFSPKSPRSKFQDFFFLFALRPHLVNRYFLAPILSLVQGWGWGLELSDASDRSRHVATDFPTVGAEV